MPADGRGAGKLPFLAIFRADASLELVAAIELPNQLQSGKGAAGFAAVNSEGQRLQREQRRLRERRRLLPPSLLDGP